MWRAIISDSSCTEQCRCSYDTTSCGECPYKMVLKNNSRVVTVGAACCRPPARGGRPARPSFVGAVAEVSFHYDGVCNTSSISLDFPTLETYAIDLSNNSLRKININVRQRILRTIDLSRNKLQYVTKGLFNSYVNLIRLKLNNNEIVSVLEGSFDGLTKLESLDLSENKLTILSNVFSPLKNLQHLNLGRNNIECIHENYFNNWLLQHLDVSHNNLKKVAPGALQLLPNLARLLLTDNPHLGLTQLDTQLLVGTGRRLQQVDASRTGLYQVPEAFTHSVRFLSLVGNRISAIRCGDLDSYPLLQSLDFTDNKIINVEDDALGRLEMLLFLNINKNLLTIVPKSLPDELKYLSLNNNLIKNVSIPDFKNLPNLRILLLQNNQIRYIQDHVFDDLLSLEMLDLSNNPIQMLTPNTFDGPLSLRDLRLCYLNVSLPEADGAFPVSSPESIQMLHLQSSPGLARQLLADSAALAALSHLQYLDLRLNNLSNIRKDLLFYLVQLKTLRLHGNKINCSSDMWPKEWIYWNKSSSKDESCYYTTSDSREEETKYNCTFSETFTISESLPPVNLYSTEMINKLLRYYGYFNNKTERVSVQKENLGASISQNSTKDLDMNKQYNISNDVIAKKYVTSDLSFREKKIGSQKQVNEYSSPKLKETSQAVIENGYRYDHVMADNKHGDSKNNITSTNHETKQRQGVQSPDITDNSRPDNRSKSGKRLNTPVEPREYLDTSKKNHKYRDEATTASSRELENSTDDKRNIVESEYSPYQWSGSPSARYVGTVAVSALAVASLVLWASFRLRRRRRRGRAAPPALPRDDHIEVANISGGVLW
ncbi:Leucine-rich repeat-containing protein 15 [Eumeta japonica]|uniref:Leucine-rich repeat-containing protein 15 n=1 Tax=Eumeta variegata TaxID=151549 RepID=A0A4C1YU99_EUMVA|nr:Leucine-rich repeat-containing protein 15 [Eumeta japonica]